MNITELLIPQYIIDNDTTQQENRMSSIHDDDLMLLWERHLLNSGYHMQTSNERNTLTDAVITQADNNHQRIPVHIKVIGRHMNGSFRCHIGTSKASRPIKSTELCDQMRLLVVFFRIEKSQLISPDFIFFPTWLLHLFRYTEYENTPGRTDVRFLENENMAKEDHIYRLNHVLNTLFRFNLNQFDSGKLQTTIELSNFLFDYVGLDLKNLPKPLFNNNLNQPIMYSTLLLLLHTPRPVKIKAMCFNCNTKPASRRKLCVACYRYQLKHGESRPLRLIVANRPGPRLHDCNPAANKKPNLPLVFYTPPPSTPNTPPTSTTLRGRNSSSSGKYCANCHVQETHQWYRNLCGHGHWCETCKSYYLRHTKVRPPELFNKAAKRKVDVRNLVNWSTWSWDDIPSETVEAATLAINNNKVVDYYFGDNNLVTSPTSSLSSSSCSPATPPPYDVTPTKRLSYYFTCSSSSSSSTCNE